MVEEWFFEPFFMFEWSREALVDVVELVRVGRVGSGG